MVSTVQFAVGVIGNVISLCLFFSPPSTFIKICQTKSVGKFSPVPYIATLLNCLLWFYYGTPFVKMGVLVMSINGIGIIIESFYLSIFLLFTRRNSQKLKTVLLMILGVLMFFTMVVLVNMLAFHQQHKKEVMVGILCVIIGTSMYISPLTIMKTVITTRSTEYMPLALSIFNLLNGAVWTIYAILGRDLFITIPNALGVLFAICQLTLYMCYCGTSTQNHASTGATVSS